MQWLWSAGDTLHQLGKTIRKSVQSVLNLLKHFFSQFCAYLGRVLCLDISQFSFLTLTNYCFIRGLRRIVYFSFINLLLLPSLRLFCFLFCFVHPHSFLATFSFSLSTVRFGFSNNVAPFQQEYVCFSYFLDGKYQDGQGQTESVQSLFWCLTVCESCLLFGLINEWVCLKIFHQEVFKRLVLDINVFYFTGGH